MSEHRFPKRIIAVYLVGAPFDNSLDGEDLVGGFKLRSSLSLIEKNAKRIHLLFSKNDDVVSVAHAEKYRDKLKNANIVVYRHIKGHFKIAKFPEIIEIIKEDIKRK